MHMTLDERIASALDPSTDQLSAVDLLELCKEVERMSRLHEVAARQSRAKSVDPAHVDYVAARGAAEDSEFRSERYKSGFTRG